MASPDLPRRRWKNRRPDIDRDARRYYIYWLYDANGDVLYIGRSCNPLSRLKSHHATGAEWVSRVVQIEARGPFNWRTACDLERDAIEAERPPNNREFVINKQRRQPRLTA